MFDVARSDEFIRQMALFTQAISTLVHYGHCALERTCPYAPGPDSKTAIRIDTTNVQMEISESFYSSYDVVVGSASEQDMWFS
jgi:hypothetical protein